VGGEGFEPSTPGV